MEPDGAKDPGEFISIRGSLHRLWRECQDTCQIGQAERVRDNDRQVRGCRLPILMMAMGANAQEMSKGRSAGPAIRLITA